MKKKRSIITQFPNKQTQQLLTVSFIGKCTVIVFLSIHGDQFYKPLWLPESLDAQLPQIK